MHKAQPPPPVKVCIHMNGEVDGSSEKGLRVYVQLQQSAGLPTRTDLILVKALCKIREE